MTTINEDQLISAVKQVFAKTRVKFIEADQMQQLLTKEGLTSEEAKQAISLAREKYTIRVSLPHMDGFHGERCYSLVTEKDKEIDKALEKEFLKKRLT